MAIRWLLAALITLGAAEIAAELAFHRFVESRLAVHWRVDPDAVAAHLTTADLDRYRTQYYDSELGWVFGQNTTAIPYTHFDRDGARADPLSFPAGAFAAYGDSFTFGEDVADDATWPHELALLRHQAVTNYGVAGYGPDQAVLRLRRNLQRGDRPQIVVLGVLSENIARVVNRWRAMYAVGGEPLNFKPRLRVSGGSTAWLPNPLANLDSVTAVAAAVHESATGDYWASYNARRPVPHFPYLLTAAATASYLAFDAVRWQDLWNMPEPVATMDAVIGEFVGLSRTYGFTPVLVMIPMPEDLRARDARVPTSYASALARIGTRYGSALAVADVAAAAFDSARFNLKPYAGHASPEGNRVIAAAIAAALP